MLSHFSCVQLFAALWTIATLWSPPGSSVHEIYQARILDWVAMPSFKGPSRLRDQTQVFCLTGGFFTAEPLRKPSRQPRDSQIPALQKLGCLHFESTCEPISKLGTNKKKMYVSR